MSVLRDYKGLAIRLTGERLAHIMEHPEMAGLENTIAETLALTGLRQKPIVVGTSPLFAYGTLHLTRHAT